MLDGYIETRDKLSGRIREVRLALETATGAERLALKDRLRMLKEMRSDICDSIRQIQRPERHRPSPRTVYADGYTWDFFERSGACWSDAEGTTWAQLQAMASAGNQREQGALGQLMGRAVASISDTQRRRMGRYFGEGLDMHTIAAAEGVARSTVSRCIRRGMEGVERYVFARLFLKDCMGRDGHFDYIKFARNTAILTDRQLELLYVALTTDESYRQIAERLGLNCSTVSRTLSRASQRMAQVSVGLERVTAAEVPEAGTEKQIAELLGLPPVFFYRFLRRWERVGTLPRYHYELLRLRDAGLTAAQAGAQLGVSDETVRRYWRQYRETDITALTPTEDDYHPAERGREVARFDLRRALADYCAGEA